MKKHIQIIERMMFAMANYKVDGIKIHPTLRIAKKALERREPKKIRVNDESWYCCPSCAETFKLFDNFNQRNKYCGNCGQALDWSETE